MKQLLLLEHKHPEQHSKETQSARESPAANKSLLSTPVPPRAASSHKAEVASHEQPKAGRTNFNLCQPCSLIKRHLVAVVHAVFPDHRHLLQAAEPLTPPSPVLPLPAPQYLAVVTLFFELIHEALGELVALSQGHEAVEALALQGVGVADHGSLSHCRVLQQGRLHLCRAQQVACKQTGGRALQTCTKTPEALKGPELQI